MGHPLIAALAGAAAGVLSACGIGGGTLLLIYMTSLAGVEQAAAQGINLLYFLPTAAIALPSHIKNGFIDRTATLSAIPAGLVTTALASWTATAVDVSLLRRLFGLYLIYIGTRMLFQRQK